MGIIDKGLGAIEYSTDGVEKYFPCDLVMKDGSTKKNVIIIVTPRADTGWSVGEGNELDWSDVAKVLKNPDRLPPHLASYIYSKGETGMGYYAFTLIDQGGRKARCMSGGIVDFACDNTDPGFEVNTVDQVEMVETNAQAEQYVGVKFKSPNHYVFIEEAEANRFEVGAGSNS